MSKLTDKIRNPTLLQRKDTPVWGGPEKEGITFSLLSRWLCCRERFRLLVVEGLKPKPTFTPAMHYGNMWHEAEEAHAKGVDWVDPVNKYCEKLYKQFPFQREDIAHWYSMCLIQFPAYVSYWEQHEDVKKRIPLEQEQVFNVPYKLPSGRVCRLKGKRDSVDLIDSGIWLQENKSKSQIDQGKISRQLSADLQTMLYLVALQHKDWTKDYNVTNSTSPINVFKPGKIKGVRYNVIRRSAHKTAASMQKKMSEDIADGRGGEWFSRWNVEISENDIEEFKKRTLNPILEQLCDWWEWVEAARKHDVSPFDLGARIGWSSGMTGIHFQSPFGVYDVLKEGGSSELDNYIATGSDIGLERVSNLFPELTE